MPTETPTQDLHDHDVEAHEPARGSVPQRTAPGRAGRPGLLGGGLRMGRLFGIQIRLHFSVLIIFGLILFSLGSATFPSWHPDWGPALTWGIATATAVLFFVSLLAHEMAHSLVAKAKGIEIHSITLFLFGGVSELKGNPKTPWTEFLIAIAGPAMSVLIGVISLVIAFAVLDRSALDHIAADPAAGLAALSPAATLLVWLGPINLLLAAFNMVPGFPLDGGRVLRSIIWGITKDPRKATRWAANSGKGVAALMAIWGGYLIIVGAFIDGLWLMFLAWFLYGAARNAYAETVLRQHISGLRVGDLMDTSVQEVDADEDVAAFTMKLAHRDQVLWPVMDGNRVVGTVSVQQVVTVPDEMRRATQVREIMTAIEQAPLLSAHAPAQTALQKLSESEQGIVLVVDQGKVVGLISQHDVMRWLNLFAHEK
jgi:Zn-dependent protease/predicted transcriptional regulator